MNTASKRSWTSGLLLSALTAILLGGCSAEKPVTVELLVAETPEMVMKVLEPAPLPQGTGCGGLAGATGSCGGGCVGQSQAPSSGQSASKSSVRANSKASLARQTRSVRHSGAQPWYGPVYVPPGANVTFEQVWSSARGLVTKGDPGFSL